MRAFAHVNWWITLPPSAQFQHTGKTWPDHHETKPFTIIVQRIAPDVLGHVVLKGPKVKRDGQRALVDGEIRIHVEDLARVVSPEIYDAYHRLRSAVAAFRDDMDKLVEDHPTGD